MAEHEDNLQVDAEEEVDQQVDTVTAYQQANANNEYQQVDVEEDDKQQPDAQNYDQCTDNCEEE